MTLVGTGELAAAVSTAGGFGLVSAGRLSPDDFRAQIAEARRRTPRSIGVNIPVSRDAEWMREAIAVAASEPIRAVVLGGGNPAPWVETIRASGKALMIVVADARQARKAEQLGAAIAIAEGVESGGKTSADELSCMTLIPLVARAVGIPVVAAGGIVDGTTAAAALCLGASGVQMGTRFLMSSESPVHPATMRALVGGERRQTMIIGRSHGMHRRVVRNQAAEDVARRETAASHADMISLLSGERSERGLRQGDVADGLIACGQGLELIDDVPSAAGILERTIRQLSDTLFSTARRFDDWSLQQAARE